MDNVDRKQQHLTESEALQAGLPGSRMRLNEDPTLATLLVMHKDILRVQAKQGKPGSSELLEKIEILEKYSQSLKHEFVEANRAGDLQTAKKLKDQYKGIENEIVNLLEPEGD